MSGIVFLSGEYSNEEDKTLIWNYRAGVVLLRIKLNIGHCSFNTTKISVEIVLSAKRK